MNEKTQFETDPSFPETTHREGQGFSHTQREPVSVSQNTTHSLIKLPKVLGERYTILQEMPAKGGEADLVLAKGPSGSSVVLKLYRSGIVPKPEILECLHQADPKYVIQQLEYGECDGRWYEIMEYAAQGSLRDVLDTENSRMDSDVVRTILKSLTDPLCYLHSLTPRVVHRDLKPENVLVRCRNPLDIVLTDFGISSVLEQSVRFTSTNRSVRYSAPEAMAGSVSPATDWWSLGIMLVEILSGRHPFAGLDERVVTNALYERRPIDLLGVADADWQMLCKGLLCFDAKKRWGATEIGRWLAGDTTLTLPQKQEAEPSSSGIRAARPYRIAGVDCWTLDEFLRTLALNWDESLKRMARRTDIERWLLNDLQDQDAYNIFLDIADAQDADPQTQLMSFLIALMPEAVSAVVEPAEVETEILKTCLQAAAGLAESERRLGFMFLNGVGLPGDALLAESWLAKAAAQGDTEAQDACKKFVQFRETLAKAEAGEVECSFAIGKMYDTGTGVVKDYTKAATWYRMAAEQGHGDAQNCLGLAYMKGIGVPQNDNIAVELFQKAAEQGNIWAQNNLGLAYENGFGVSQDHVKAIEWFQKAAMKGLDRAQCNLGRAYKEGWGVSQDYIQAEVWLRRAAKQENVFAQYCLGVLYENGYGVAQDYRNAAEWYCKAAEHGDAEAQFRLGTLYRNGHCAPLDCTNGTEWYRKAAEQGHVIAQLILANLYEVGDGLPQDYVKSAEWYYKAAEQGHFGAQVNLGCLYEDGRGVPQDYGEALKWYHKAAEQGYDVAQCNIGMLYYYGRGVQQDHVEAVKWNRRAAEGGYPVAQLGLGLAYERGQGVTQDYAQAAEWYQKAAEQGLVGAQRKLGVMYSMGNGVPRSKKHARYWYKKAIEQGDEKSKRLIEEVKGWF